MAAPIQFKSLSNKSVFMALTVICCLFLITSAIFTGLNLDTITFKKDAFTTDQMAFDRYIADVETLTDKADTLFKLKNNLPKNQFTTNYNELVRYYNFKNEAIEDLQLLKENKELKNETQRVYNLVFDYLDQKNSNTEDKKQKIKSELTELKSKALQFNNSWNRYNSATNTFIFLSFITAVSLIMLFTSAVQFNHRLQNEVKTNKAEYTTLLKVIDNMSEGVVVTDRVGFFTYYNQSALDIIGYKVKDLHYESSIDLIGFKDLQRHNLQKNDLPNTRALKNQIESDREIIVQNELHPDGIYVSVSNGVFINDKAEPSGSVMVMKNITHKKQLEELWQNEKNNALENSKKKSDFLANMSHEIRTPMNGIIGLTTLLNDTQLEKEQKDYVQTIQRSAYSLLNLINDILDHSKIESGKIEILKKPFCLEKLAQEIKDNFKFTCHEKNIEFNIMTDPKIATQHLGDELRLRQIFMNLVGNAVKFTSQGSITLKIDLLAVNQNQKIRFSVIDTGSGMEKSEVDKLFQRYFQTQSGIQFGGTGLGLNISKQLVHLMGGEIAVESQKNKGTTFWFDITLEPSKENHDIHLVNSDFSYRFAGHALVAEDNIVNQKVISQYLKKLNIGYTIVDNGQLAVETFQTAPHSYDLIFMDCNMPVMNGYIASSLLTKYKLDHGLHTPIIALTAEGPQTALKKCQDVGMIDFINKPILINEMVTVLKKYLTFSETENDIDHIKTTDSIQSTHIFNEKPLLQLHDLDTDKSGLILHLFNEFQKSSEDILSQMKISLNEKNYDSLSDLGHTLKSSSGTMGAVYLQNLCATLEKNPSLNPDLMIIQIEQAYMDVIKLIDQKIYDILSSAQRTSA